MTPATDLPARNSLIARYHSRKCFVGLFKGHEIVITREADRLSERKFYITVTAPSGERCYDGLWVDLLQKDGFVGAIEQALIGSCLIREGEDWT